MVLILDTARFKYPPHWVHVSKLCAAMGRIDSSSGRSRGFAVLSYESDNATAISSLVSINIDNEEWRQRVRDLRTSSFSNLWELMELVWENGGIFQYLTPVKNPVLTSQVEACAEMIALVESTKEYQEVSKWKDEVQQQLAAKKHDRCCDTTQTLLPVKPTV
eukprot:CAMPEP_0118635362 /NCGR_PEP_ID=MMETSP0785-20121206/2035_1 /TAXON_ID=91992 /ORGANISM="Bolidomonas pacifica, Strain CCMP 1866" /LENGTH=161 /DNA_ID=CAMNT_0006526389 /DNA_START=675 /DNA_END=1156 /DNA_ORIENTATION=+